MEIVALGIFAAVTLSANIRQSRSVRLPPTLQEVRETYHHQVHRPEGPGRDAPTFYEQMQASRIGQGA